MMKPTFDSFGAGLEFCLPGLILRVICLNFLLENSAESFDVFLQPIEHEENVDISRLGCGCDTLYPFT